MVRLLIASGGTDLRPWSHTRRGGRREAEGAGRRVEKDERWGGKRVHLRE